MVAKFPVDGETTTVSGMAWGFNPYLMSEDQFAGAYLSVVESIAKLVRHWLLAHRCLSLIPRVFRASCAMCLSAGVSPLPAVLGALMAQADLGVGAIGGKDSMSGSFEDLDVPPTLVSFAVATGSLNQIVSPEFKAAGHRVICVAPAHYGEDWRPDVNGLLDTFRSG